MNNINNQLSLFNTAFKELTSIFISTDVLDTKTKEIESSIGPITNSVAARHDSVFGLNDDIIRVDGDVTQIEQKIDLVNTTQNRISYRDLHIGEYKFSARDQDYMGWLKCDGRSLSRSTYDALFGVIGTAFGSNDNTTFNLPDFRGRIFGVNNDVYAIGQRTGAETHTLNISELPTHSHTTTVPNHGPSTYLQNDDVVNNVGVSGHTHTITDVGHTHTLTINLNPENTNPTNMYLLSTDDTDNAIALGTIQATSAATQITIPTSGIHLHSSNVMVTHADTASTNFGSNFPHNNMQPTLFAGSVYIYSGYVEPSVVVEPNVESFTTRNRLSYSANTILANTEYNYDGTAYYNLMYNIANGSTIAIDRLGTSNISVPRQTRYISKRSVSTDQLLGLISMETGLTTGTELNNHAAAYMTVLPNDELLCGFRVLYGTSLSLLNRFVSPITTLATYPTNAVLCLAHMSSNMSSVLSTNYIKATFSNSLTKINFKCGMQYYKENGMFLIVLNVVKQENDTVTLYWNEQSTPFAVMDNLITTLILIFKPTALPQTTRVSTSSMEILKVLKIKDGWLTDDAPSLSKTSTDSTIDVNVLLYDSKALTISEYDQSPSPNQIIVYDGFDTVLYTFPVLTPYVTDEFNQYYFINFNIKVDNFGNVSDAYTIGNLNGSVITGSVGTIGYCVLSNNTSVNAVYLIDYYDVQISDGNTLTNLTDFTEQNSVVLFGINQVLNVVWNVQIVINGFIAYNSFLYPGPICAACLPDDGGFVCLLNGLSTTTSATIRSSNGTIANVSYSNTRNVLLLKFDSAGVLQWHVSLNDNGHMNVTVSPLGYIILTNVYANALSTVRTTIRDSAGTIYNSPANIMTSVVFKPDGTLNAI